MAKSETISPERLKIFAQELNRGAKIQYEYFDKFVSPSGWTQIDPGDPIIMKIKCVGHGLFAKMYAPAVERYAIAAAQTLNELSALKTSVPILGALSLEGSTLFLRQGKFKSKDRLSSLLDPEEIKSTKEIIKRNGLEPLGDHAPVVVVEINGKNFIVDPFDDNNANIGDYINRSL